MNIHHHKNIYVYFFLLLLCCADISQFFFFKSPYIYFLLCFYCLTLFHTPKPKILLATAILLSLESFSCYSKFSLPLFYLVPATIMSLLIRQNLYTNHFQVVILLCLGLFAQIYGIEAYLLGISSPHIYTIGKISVNIILVSYFSLTSKNWGKHGNRS